MNHFSHDEDFQNRLRSYRPIETLRPDHWLQSSYTAEDGAQLSYWRTGNSKRPLLLLHGFQSSSMSWLRLAQALQPDYDCIMVDFRGHGASNNVIDDFGLERMTTDIMDLIQHLALEDAVIIGHSMGAEIAGRLAASNPDAVRAIVLIDPPMQAFHIPQSDEPSPWVQQWLQTMQTLKIQTHQERLLTALQLVPPGMSQWDEADYVALVESMAHLNTDLVKTFNNVNYAVATPEILDQIQCPTLLIVGHPEKGSTATPDGIATFQAKGALVQIVQLDTGHFVQAEALETVVDSITSFLAEHD